METTGATSPRKHVAVIAAIEAIREVESHVRRMAGDLDYLLDRIRHGEGRQVHVNSTEKNKMNANPDQPRLNPESSLRDMLSRSPDEIREVCTNIHMALGNIEERIGIINDDLFQPETN
ncbi:MAG: hypothetical protein SCH71_17000 [Desulfobulbaceae bacterium]|nr:hypothetical protein [Desulfobulbaceae bacterium]